MHKLSGDRRQGTEVRQVSGITIVSGQGIEGVVDGEVWRIGRSSFVSDKPLPEALAMAVQQNPSETLVFLGTPETGIRAFFAFSDTLRPDAKAAVAALKGQGVRTLLLSGDRREVALSVAAELGMDEADGGLLPEDKRDRVVSLQQQGKVVAMIGDGINDAPALAQAQISISLGSATSLAQWTADVIILSDELLRLDEALRGARYTLTIIRENLTWAVLYNLVAIPAAACGLVTPLLAAIGMSVSSLLVVLNALRVLRLPTRQSPKPLTDKDFSQV